MTNPNKTPDWEHLYRELEASLLPIFQSFADVLDEHESSQCEHSTPVIRRAGKYDLEGKPLLVCVADGENLEYRFTLVARGETVLQTSFQRSNSLPLDHRFFEPNCSAIVEVRSNSKNSGAKIIARKVDF